MPQKRKNSFYIILTILLIAGTLLLTELAGFMFISLHLGGIGSRADLKNSLDIHSKHIRGDEIKTEETGLPGWMQTHILHPYIGFVRNPRLSRQVFNNRVIPLPVNEYGFFGNPPPADLSDDKMTIAITGGSVALELFLYARDVLQHELARLPALKDKDIDIVCLALGGMKQPQQLMALNYFLSMGRRLDMLINCDGFNEVALPFAQNVPYNIHPFYPRTWGIYAKKAMNMDAAVLYGDISESRTKLEKWRGRMSKWPFRHSNFWLVVWHRIKSREENRQIGLDLEIRELLKIKKHTHPQETGPLYTTSSEQTIFSDCIAMWKESSLQMWRLCAANGMGYVHCLQPNQYLKGSKPLNDWERRHVYAGPQNLSRKTVENGYPGLIAGGQELAEMGLPFHDLTQLFKDNTETLYRDNSCHYNDKGYELLARRMARIIGAGL